MKITSIWRRTKLGGWLAMLLLATVLIACGGGGGDSHDPILYTTEIISDVNYDGDIAFTPPDTYTITTANTTGSVFTGVDPDTGDEFRGFLDFYLGDTDGVPLGAAIASATISVYITSITEAVVGAGVPLLIDLVNFQPPELIASDYDRTLQPPLLTLQTDIRAADVGRFVTLDVTSLMTEAQIQELPDFQLRLVLDFAVDAGLVEIEDSIQATAPLLTVTYFFP